MLWSGGWRKRRNACLKLDTGPLLSNKVLVDARGQADCRARNGARAMTAAKTDRRVERTRSALMSAFVELMLSGGYAGVTVEDIATRANVGRSTFYMHFKSREDILQRSLERPSAPLAAVAAGTMSAERLVPQLQHFHEQRRVNRIFFEPPLRELWVKCLAPLIERALAARRARLVLPIGLVAALIAETQIALIANWLRSSPQTKAATVADALVATTTANLSALTHAANRTP
jgi:AcrR family transcriptional regulator